MTRKDKRIQHYGNSQKILLVGEGDFSFSACLARAFGSAENMVATSLDSKETLLRKYESPCEEHLEELKKRGCKVLHEVDVQDMNKHRKLKAMKFDVVIFNFPHSGHVSWLCETDAILIERHKNLLKSFFASANGMLKEDGEVHVTHRDNYPYNEWQVENQAQKAGLVLKEKVKFVKQNYLGYNNKRGRLIRGDKRFPLEDTFTFKFSLDLQKTTFRTSTVSGSNLNKSDSSPIQSNQKFTLEAELLSAFPLTLQETTVTGVNVNSANKSFTLKDSCTSKSSLDPQGMTSTSCTSNKNIVTLKDPFNSKSSLDHQRATTTSTSNKNIVDQQGTTSTSTSNKSIVTLKDAFTSKSSLDHQGTTSTSTSNKSIVTLKDPLTSKSSLDHQGMTSKSPSNKSIVTLKDPFTSKSSLNHQGTTSTSTSNKNIVTLKDPFTSKYSLDYQGMASTNTSNKNVTTPKDLYDNQGMTSTSISNKNVTVKDPSKFSLHDQETTLSSIAVSHPAQVLVGHGNDRHDFIYHEETNNIAVRDYGDDIKENLAFFKLWVGCVFGLIVKLAKLAIKSFFIFFVFLILLSMIFESMRISV